jgi:N-acetylmuramoyl-L-alanine amidase
VLRFSRVPATLVEIGFLTNRAEEQALRTTAYRQRVARAIADGIATYRAGSK